MTDEPAALAPLPPLRETIAAYGLDAQKKLGQHFLLDLNLTRRIVRAAGSLAGQHVAEVGPGPGGLTRALVESDAASVLAIEKDPRCIAALQPLLHHAAPRLQLVEGDALRLNLADLLPAPRCIIANLPYNVGTPLLINWLHQGDAYQQLLLMFQKEVAQRIVAAPRQPAYGRLSVLCQFVATCSIALTLPARAFTPPPKVDSAVVKLVIKPHPLPVALAALERVTAAAFGQRRKMLRSIFKNQLDDAGFARLGIKPEARAEELDIAAFIRLAQAFA